MLNTARSRVNEIILTPAGAPVGADPGQQLTQVGGGTLLTELNPDGSLCLRTQIIFNSAFRKFQKYLANLGWRGLIDTLTIPAMPANTQADPTIQSWLSWNGNFNGTVFAATPALPSTFYAPLKLWERVSGSNGDYQPMQSALNGLRNFSSRSTLSRKYEWRKNALWFPGSTVTNDLQIRAVTFFPDLVATGSPATPWYYQLIPVPGSLSSLAWYVVIEVCFPRGDEPGFQGALAQAQDEADKIFNDQARGDQRPPAVNEGVARSGATGAPGTSGAAQ